MQPCPAFDSAGLRALDIGGTSAPASRRLVQ